MAERRHFECDVCGREFTRQSSVNRHMRTHTGERPYERDVCHKTFTRNHLLVAHKRTHTDERPYGCDVCIRHLYKAGVDLRNVQKWLSLNKLSLNIAKTEYILIASRHKITRIDVQPTVKTNSQHIKRVKCTKVLGVQIDEHLSWNQHIEYIANKISSGIGAIRKLRTFIDNHTGEQPYENDVCGRRFSVLSNMRSHRDTHPAV